MNPRRFVALCFLVFPLAIQVPFARLAAVFRYPAILRESPAEILAAFHQGGTALIASWYLFAITILIFLAGALALAHVQEEKPSIALRAAGVLAAVSALVQMTGLLRWVFVVPLLARQFMEAQTDEARALVTTLFTVQHQAFGVVLGEHLGQLFLSLWTLAVAFGLASAPKVLRALGIAAGLTMLAGISDGFATVLPVGNAVTKALPMLGFVLWSIWLLYLGVTLMIRREPDAALSSVPA
jgi:hypothetical protein